MTPAMTPDHDTYPAQTSPGQTSPAYPAAAAAPLEEDRAAAALFQEINERRARIENAELLRHLRGL